MRRSDNVYVKWGLTVFFTVCAILLLYDTFFSRGTLVLFARRTLGIVAPVLYGLFIAYLLAPVVNFFERNLPEPMRRVPAGKFRSPVARAISILLTMLTVFIFFYLLMSILMPQLYKSVLSLVGNAESYYNQVNHWLNDLLHSNPEVEQWVTDQLDVSYRNLLEWLTDTVAPQAQQVLGAVTGGIMSVLVFAKNLLVGLIVSVYLLAAKEGCAASSRRMVYALLTQKHAGWLLWGLRRVDAIFSGFVRGKLLDSLIIGILCFIFSSWFQFPYAPLVSVVVGVTNVIPFFGPFLGAIPSAFLILLVDPLKCFYFVLFVLALQQLDGNVIGPRILGDSTGLSSFWVIVAILVGGGFFGIPGMFFGVPIFACLYTAVNAYVNYRLRKKDLPVEVLRYTAEHNPAPDSGEKNGEN